MKILYLHQVPFNNRRANVIQVLQMCQGFAGSDVDVTLALPAHAGSNGRDTLLKEIESELGRTPQFDIRCFPKRFFGDAFKGLGAYLGARRLIHHFRGEVDFCFVRSIFLARLALRHGMKVIYESHGSTLHHRLKLLDRIYRKRLIALSKDRNLILFVAISHALANIWKMRGIPGDKIMALHDGVSSEAFQKTIERQEARKRLRMDPDGKIVVYAGSLYQDRSIDTILRLARIHETVRFYVVGGPESGKVRYLRETKEMGLGNVVFTGRIPHSLVKWYLFAADVLLMLWSRQVPTIHICSPLKVFEYMAAERIIVGHGFPTIREVLNDGETAFLSDPDSFEDLKDKLERALQITLPHPMAIRARKKALQSYTWESRAYQIIGAAKCRISDISA